MGPEIVSSGQHAMRAFRESVRSASHHAYSVNDLGDLIGPMTPDELIVMDADGNKIEVDILIDEQADAAVEVFKDYGQKSK